MVNSIILKNASIIDGSGKEPYLGHVQIIDDKIDSIVNDENVLITDNAKVIDHELGDVELDGKNNIKNLVHLVNLDKNETTTPIVISSAPIFRKIVDNTTTFTVDTSTNALSVNGYAVGYNWNFDNSYRPVAAIEIARYDWDFENNIYNTLNTTDTSDDEL